jgi:hypothetical protein
MHVTPNQRLDPDRQPARFARWLRLVSPEREADVSLF